MIKLLKYLKWQEWILAIVTLFVLCVHAFCNLLLPEYMANLAGIIQDAIDAQDISLLANNWTSVLITVAKMFGVIVGIISCIVLVGYLSATLTTNLMARIRGKVFAKVNSFSMVEINKFSIASLVTRCTNDITQLQTVYHMILGIGITAPLTAIFAIIRVVNISVNLSFVNIASVLLLVSIVVLVFYLVIPKFKTVQKATDKLNLLTRENLTGIRVIRAYSAEKQQEAKFEVTNKRYTKLDLFINRVFAIIDPGISLIMQGTSLAIVWLIPFVGFPSAELETITRFTQYSNQIIMGFMTISMLFMIVPRGIVSAKRINEILDSSSSIVDGQFDGKILSGVFCMAEDFKEVIESEKSYDLVSKYEDKKDFLEDLILQKQIKSAQQKLYLFSNNALTNLPHLKKKAGSVKFEHVYFKYPNADQYVLEDISFEAKPGQTVAFIGSTGSGKSTLINLIPRFYDASEGKITIDGVDVKQYELEYLHDKLGYVPQKGVLFSGSVENNIKYGNDSATDQEINKAIETSESSFVYGFEGRLEHFISQGGKNVSGGQKQRLSIARAIVKKPEIFIFDDSFSALDYKTDKSLRKKLKKYMGNATCLIVAQRIGTISSADQIIVLDQGKIVGQGKHKDLLKNCQVYREIALSQLSEEELK